MKQQQPAERERPPLCVAHGVVVVTGPTNLHARLQNVHRVRQEARHALRTCEDESTPTEQVMLLLWLLFFACLFFMQPLANGASPPPPNSTDLRHGARSRRLDRGEFPLLPCRG